MADRKTISRRQFVKGTAVAGAGVAASGALFAPALAQTEAPEWDKEADVIVVGYGCAGASAALGALEEGATVIVLEKGDGPSGATPVSGGTVWLPLNPLQEQDDSVEDVITYLTACAKGNADPALIELFAENSGPTAEWLIDDIGLVATQPNRYDYHMDYEGAGQGRNISSEGRGAGLMETLATAAEERGAEVITETTAKRLVVNADGRVIGVLAEHDGEEVAYGARKAVILCAGGFASNEEMKRSFLPVYPCLSQVDGILTGDGILMGMAVGAGLRAMNADVGVPLYRVGDTNVGVSAAVRTRPTCIMVNRYGERFCNESADYDSVQATFYAFDLQADTYRNVPAWFIFDDTARAAGAVTGVVGWSTDNLAEIEEGLIQTAETIEELAELIEIDPEALAATVEAYNEAAENGEDPLFHRGEPPGTPGPEPLATPPFYAMQVYPGLYDTMGGLTINQECQVLTALGNVIPGLYAAGTNANMALGYFYPNGGTAIGQAIFFGRLAGQTAAAEEA